MPRTRTGTIKRHGDHYDARITLNHGSRPWMHLGAEFNTEKKARAEACALAEQAHREGWARMPEANGVAAGDGETFAAVIRLQNRPRTGRPLGT